MPKLLRYSVVVGLAVLGLHCGGDSTSPTTPSTPTIAQVAGDWTGTTTLTSVIGGECVGTVFQTMLGLPFPFTAAVTQTGSTLSATVTLDITATTCSYSGTAGSNTVTLNVTSCEVGGSFRRLPCAGGVVRDMQLIGGSITGTVSGNTVSGTLAEMWNIFVGPTSVSVEPLTLNSTFSISR